MSQVWIFCQLHLQKQKQAPRADLSCIPARLSLREPQLEGAPAVGGICHHLPGPWLRAWRVLSFHHHSAFSPVLVGKADGGQVWGGNDCVRARWVGAQAGRLDS